MKRKIFCFFTGLMVLTFAACGKGKEDFGSSKEHVYKTEAVELSEVEDPDRIGNFYIKNDRMYFSCYNWSEESNTLSLISMNLDGSDSEVIELEMGNNSSYTYLTTDKEGNYYAVLDEYFEDDSDPENYIWHEDYYLVKLDRQGNEVWKKALNDGIEGEYWLKWMKVLSDGRIVVGDTEGITVYDTNGELVNRVAPQEENDTNEVYLLKDDTIVLNIYKEESNRNVLSRLNIETGEMTGEYVIPGNDNYGLYPANEFDFLLSGRDGIYGYDLGDEKPEELMNFIDSDLDTTNVYDIADIDKKEFYGLMNDNLTGELQIMRFTKVDPKDVADKVTLSLACSGLDWEVRSEIVRFNKSNPNYRIKIKDYSQYDTDEDYTAGVNKLNADIASGDIPDILMLRDELPVESYISKGLFEDLYPYIDKDEEINREDFLPNVLSAYETNGKMYRLVPKFTVYTVAGKTADVGMESGWTLEKLNALLASKPEGTQVFVDMTRDGMLSYSIQMAGEQFINWETGQCNFNSEGFIELLEFIKQFPEQFDDDYYDENYWNNYDTMWREGKVLLRIMYMDSFYEYNVMAKGIYGEDITLVGFPTENRTGSALSANLDMVMSSKSRNKEGVWQFMRYFLTDEYQDQIEYGWPLSMKRLKALGENAKKKPTYEDEDGNTVEYDQTYYIGGVEITIDPMTQQEVDKVIDFIQSVDQVHSYNQGLINIISEEAAPYFAGQKNAKEVADIIQSRVQIYVNENS